MAPGQQHSCRTAGRSQQQLWQQRAASCAQHRVVTISISPPPAAALPVAAALPTRRGGLSSTALPGSSSSCCSSQHAFSQHSRSCMAQQAAAGHAVEGGQAGVAAADAQLSAQDSHAPSATVAGAAGQGSMGHRHQQQVPSSCTQLLVQLPGQHPRIVSRSKQVRAAAAAAAGAAGRAAGGSVVLQGGKHALSHTERLQRLTAKRLQGQQQQQQQQQEVLHTAALGAQAAVGAGNGDAAQRNPQPDSSSSSGGGVRGGHPVCASDLIRCFREAPAPHGSSGRSREQHLTVLRLLLTDPGGRLVVQLGHCH